MNWIDARIEEYLNDLDRADQEEPAPTPAPTREELQEKIRRLKDRKTATGKLLSNMDAQGVDEISLTDPDSRKMPQNPKTPVGYNIQLAVDAKHALIVAHDVINHPSDRPLLYQISEEAKEALCVDEIAVVADAGYYKGEEIKRCEDQKIHPYVPKPATSSATPRGLYSKDQFTYDKERDLYICPAGEVMPYQRTGPTKRPGHLIRYYGTMACKTCLHRPQCTTNKTGQRWITRWEHENVLDQMEQRIRANPELLSKRRQLVEHPFGTIKFWNDQSHFLVRGLETVKGEFSLMALAQNLKRVISLVGVPQMIRAAA